MAAMTVGQLPPRRVAGEQRVERRVAQQSQREREPVGGACGSRVDAARPCPPGSSGSSGAASGSRRRGRGVTARSPNQLASMISPSVAAASRANCSPSPEPLASHHDVALARRVVRVRVRDAEPSRTPPPSSGPRRRASTSTPGMPRASRATAQPIMPAPTTRDAIADEGRGIPQHVHRGLDRARRAPPGGRGRRRARPRPRTRERRTPTDAGTG